MKTKAVRLYGKDDLRLEEFELPAIAEDEILARIVSDSICMSSYKAAQQGAAHKRVPDDVADNPVIIGHEFCGVIVEVGAKWQDQYKPGDRFAIQPNLNYQGTLYSPGYSFAYIGGSATHIVIPHQVMELGCLLPYRGEAFFHGSLAEPMSCIVGAYHAQYHTEAGVYQHKMGIVPGGRLALLACAGPMGLGAIDYALHGDIQPSLLVVTDVDEARLSRAQSIFTIEDAKKQGVELLYVNTALHEDPVAYLRGLTGGAGFDDVFAYAPIRQVVEQADAILGRDGCLNFFAGPTDTGFSAMMNFYNVHYGATHIVGTSGGNTDDLIESIHLMEEGRINLAAMVTHIGGLDAVIDTTLRLPKIPGGKKLIYTGIRMPLTAIGDMAASEEPLLQRLGEIVDANGGLWCVQAEQYLLDNAQPIEL